MGRQPDRTNLTEDPALAAWSQPTRLAAAVFAAKCAVYQAERYAEDLLGGPPQHGRGEADAFPAVLAQSRTPLWSDERLAERGHQRGKVHNLRRAAAALNGVVIPAGELFSFWRQIGPATEARGYASGRMLQQGCLVPAVGGGLCQLSNALYQVAADSGCEIVERHGHSRVVPGSVAEAGRDATVAWNYVDLRFRPSQAVRLEVSLTSDELVLRVRGTQAVAPTRRKARAPLAAAETLPMPQIVRTCSTCDQVSCFRHDPARQAAAETTVRTAFLVDENWPEFQTYVAEHHSAEDLLATPFDGASGPARYRWAAEGFAKKGSANLAALRRSWAIRRAGAQGPKRRQAELDGAAVIARRLARLAGPEADRLVVAQSLLPFLWRDGELGGRRYSVLMSRVPMDTLQARLDTAFAAHADRKTLGDFRAPPWLAEAERAALAAAEQVITPHAGISALFGDRATLVPWVLPPAHIPKDAQVVRRVAFPGPTVARKGAWELREAARALDLEVVLLGSELEGDGFWDGVRTLRPAAPGAWLDGVAAVVQPALVEDQPRRLLAALAAGVPVVATAACGIALREGLTLVAEDDAGALEAALKSVLNL